MRINEVDGDVWDAMVLRLAKQEATITSLRAEIRRLQRRLDEQANAERRF